jgi:hypothetical protein
MYIYMHIYIYYVTCMYDMVFVYRKDGTTEGSTEGREIWKGRRNGRKEGEERERRKGLPDDRGAAFPGGVKEGGLPVLVQGVDGAFFVEQEFYDGEVTVVGRQVKGGFPSGVGTRAVLYNVAGGKKTKHDK